MSDKSRICYYLKIFLGLGLDVYLYNELTKRYTCKGEFNNIADATLRPTQLLHKDMPCCKFDDSNIGSIYLDAWQDKAFEFQNFTKIAKKKDGEAVGYYYFFKLPSEIKENPVGDSLDGLYFNCESIIIDYEKYCYEPINKIHIKHTAIIDEDTRIALTRYNIKAIEYKKEHGDTPEFYTLNKNADLTHYKMPFNLLHNYIVEDLSPNDLKGMNEQELYAIENFVRQNKVRGLPLTTPQKRIVEAFLILISNSNFIFNTEKNPSPQFKISPKQFSKLFHNENSRPDKILKTMRSFSGEQYIFKIKISGSKHYAPMLGIIFRYTVAKDGDYIFTFSKYFIKGIRPMIKDDAYFIKNRPSGFYDSLDLGRGYARDNCVYTFMDYLSLIQNQNHGNSTPYLKICLMNLIQKIGLGTVLKNKGIVKVFERFNKYLKYAHEIGFLELKQFETFEEFRKQLKSTESLNINFLPKEE